MVIEKYIDEVWKPIRGYEGLYEVSNYGRIKSLNYYKKGKHMILRLTAKPSAYIKVGLRKGGKTKYYRIHRLVAEAFLPPPQQGQHYVNHINGDKQNNYVCVDGSKPSNLEWCTAKQNANNPNTKQNYYIRYHKEGEFERRSAGQRKRFRERPEDLRKLREGWKRWYSNSGRRSSL